MSLGTANEVFCSCGDIIFEIDSIFCSSCGDIACKKCYTDCWTCGKMFCSNCSQDHSQCLKCYTHMHQKQPKQTNEKAFLVLEDRVPTPIKNSAFMIQKTSIDNARDIRLNLNGKEYRFCYRSMVANLDNMDIFDYFLFFEEVKSNHFDEFEKQVKNLFDNYEGDEYDDYGTISWGW